MAKGVKIYDFYFKTYAPFFDLLYAEVTKFTSKQTDNALWAFGKFLSGYQQMAD